MASSNLSFQHIETKFARTSSCLHHTFKKIEASKCMADDRIFQCPHCALQMTVRVPESPVQVTCPTCFQRILLVPGEVPRAPNESYLSEFYRLPEPIIIDTQVPAPAKSQRVIRRAARRAARHANREASKKKRQLLLQIASVAAIGHAINGTAATYT